MTDPAGRGEKRPGDGDTGTSSGFQVPAQPPIPGYPAPGSGVQPPGWPGPYQQGAPGPYQQGAPYPYQQGGPGPYRPFPTDPYRQIPSDPFQSIPPDPYHVQYQNPYPQHPGFGAPYPPQRPRRPGTVTGAAVLAFVLAGFDLVGGIGALGVTADVVDGGRSGWGSGLLVAALASLAVGGLLIGGGVTMLRGRRTLLLAGAGCTALIALYWFAAAPQLGGSQFGSVAAVSALTRFYPVVYLAIAAVMAGLALSHSAQRWHPDPGRAG